ncbi:hypothetical protein [Phascolarctobacterium succinatutens]
MDEKTLAKEFVLALIKSGNITTPSQAVQAYIDMVAMLSNFENQR